MDEVKVDIVHIKGFQGSLDSIVGPRLGVLIRPQLAADEEVLPLDLARGELLLEGLPNGPLVTIGDPSVNELQAGMTSQHLAQASLGILPDNSWPQAGDACSISRQAAPKHVHCKGYEANHRWLLA